MLFRQGHPEDAEPGQFVDDPDRDQLVLAMPFLGVGRHRALGEAADLVLDHLEGRVAEPDLAVPRRATIAEPSGKVGGQTGARVAEAPHQPPGIAGAQGPQLIFGEAEILWPRDLALRHRNPARKLRQIVAERDRQDSARLDRPPNAPPASRRTAHARICRKAST